MLKLVEKGPSATVEQIAAIEFKARQHFRGLDKIGRIRKAHELVDNVRGWMIIATEILACEKEELIAKVEARHDEWGPCLMQLAEGAEDVRALLETLSCAENRLAVALANVERDDES